MQALQEPKAPFENRRPPSGLGFVMGRGAPIASTRLALEHICCVGHWRTTRLLYNWTLEGHCFYISLHADSLYYNWIYVYICEVALLEILFVCFHVFLNWKHIVSRLHNIIAISNLLFVECQGMSCNAFAGFLFMWTRYTCMQLWQFSISDLVPPCGSLWPLGGHCLKLLFSKFFCLLARCFTGTTYELCFEAHTCWLEVD